MKKYRLTFFMVLRTGGYRVFAAFFLFCACFCTCSTRAQDAISPDMAKAFTEAGLSLLKEKLPPRDFSLPMAVPGTIGKLQNLKELKGKVVFLNFWATWCGPCRAEMPSMQALYDRYKDKGLEILAVNCGEEAEQVVAFMKNNKLLFPSVLDRDNKVSMAYGIQAIPASYLIDREGNIIARVTGSINWDTPKIHAVMEHLLK